MLCKSNQLFISEYVPSNPDALQSLKKCFESKESDLCSYISPNIEEV